MSILSLILLSIGLCFDTFAVSLSGGICMPMLTGNQRLKMIAVFAFFQGGLAALGWGLGLGVSEYIAAWDHWIAFFLLLFIGGKMIYEGSAHFKDDTVCINLLNNKVLCTVALATSIDALMVGVSLAMINFQGTQMTIGTCVIGLVTAIAAAVGLMGGAKLGKRTGKRAEIFGGLILIAIGVKILIEHFILGNGP